MDATSGILALLAGGVNGWNQGRQRRFAQDQQAAQLAAEQQRWNAQQAQQQVELELRQKQIQQADDQFQKTLADRKNGRMVDALTTAPKLLADLARGGTKLPFLQGLREQIASATGAQLPPLGFSMTMTDQDGHTDTQENPFLPQADSDVAAKAAAEKGYGDLLHSRPTDLTRIAGQFRGDTTGQARAVIALNKELERLGLAAGIAPTTTTGQEVQVPGTFLGSGPDGKRFVPRLPLSPTDAAALSGADATAANAARTREEMKYIAPTFQIKKQLTAAQIQGAAAQRAEAARHNRVSEASSATSAAAAVTNANTGAARLQFEKAKVPKAVIPPGRAEEIRRTRSQMDGLGEKLRLYQAGVDGVNGYLSRGVNDAGTALDDSDEGKAARAALEAKRDKYQGLINSTKAEQGKQATRLEQLNPFKKKTSSIEQPRDESGRFLPHQPAGSGSRRLAVVGGVPYFVEHLA